MKESAILREFNELFKNGFPEAEVWRQELERNWRSDGRPVDLERMVEGTDKSLDILERKRNKIPASYYIEKRNRLRVDQETARSELYRIRDNRIDLTDELIRQTKRWSSSSLFGEEEFRRFVEKVTVHGKDDFTFRFFCGLEIRTRAK